MIEGFSAVDANGVTTLRNVALRPNLKVLFIKGYAENAPVGTGHLEPGVVLLIKRFKMEALKTNVADTLERPG